MYYYLQPSNNYVDIDECFDEDHNNCTQLCYNTEGSYSCSCQDGYYLQDYYKCLGRLIIICYMI